MLPALRRFCGTQESAQSGGISDSGGCWRPARSGAALPAPIGCSCSLATTVTHGRSRPTSHGAAGHSVAPSKPGIEHTTPYALRHSFASLLLHEGRSVIYVARQLGHDTRLTLTRYGHVIDGSTSSHVSERKKRSRRPVFPLGSPRRA